MGASIRWTARLRALLRRWRGAPLTWLIVGGFVLMAATAIGTALTVDRFRQNAIESGRDSLESAVRLLARHFDREFEDFAVLQKSVIAELESHGITSADVFRSEMGTLAMHEVLRAKASGWSDVAGANVFDSNGTLINSSRRWPVADISVADRGYFGRLRDDPASQEEIEVVPGRLGNGSAIVFARRISGPHGEFLGMVSRAIAPEQLESFFASTGLGEESSIAMHHQNGQLLARIPHVDEMIGRNYRTGSPEQVAVFERTFVTTKLASPIDGKDRIVASRLLTGAPLVVVATRSLDATLATWRTQTKFFVTVAVLSIGLLVLTLFLIFRQMTHRLSVEKQRLNTAMNTMTQGLLMFDQDERLIVCNRRYIEMYRLSGDIVKPGAYFRDVIQHRYDAGSFEGDVDAYCDGILASVDQTHSAIVETADGRLIEIKNQPATAGGWLATHDDVTARIRADERIAHMAHYDALTDLPNRVLMRSHLERRVTELAEGKPFAILYIDVDEFKGVNDSLGHEVGDELLRQVANRLRACVSGNDLVARLGGDEFAIIKAGACDQAELAALADNILKALRTPVNCKGQEIPTDASIGIAIAPDHGDNLDDLLKRADLAMYAAKSEGRGTFRIFVPEYDAKARQRRQLELDLRQALARGEFEVHYQPLVDLAADVVNGCEALLRWRHPERGMVSPADFIPVAEDTGLIGEIGEWVLKQACHEAASWPGNIHIAVNVSPVQFRSRSLALKVAAALAESGLAPGRLELEITETVLIRDDEEALTILQQLRDLGVRIALDDFGTGYSSLSYLHRFPFDKIKIDRSFISDIGQSEDSSPIVQAVVHMAAARHMATTAEGVETEAQREVLRQLGCSQMQGWLFSPAVPAAKLKQLLSKQAEAA
ncbi:bifunctional diguanylate cyclase/phosphodiesterase [Bradyrhizobium sp.]|jgi:diguanylate cyclase (GGDEF)-like protein|uniref:bifunctional diguanylate cyclase/phosphodiesterase n=1 Tax=Bradyrhizobium sp. TaxID=376 RepID=UPI002DDD4615|nr:EAL domain-containing protein [Bradyrhizobium sp.]HEV2153052.1 EAL domain-containing protein [Bradyrhizobium sp.]